MNNGMEGAHGGVSYPQILVDYPGSKCILYPRDAGRWLPSALNISIRKQGQFPSELSEDQFCALRMAQRDLPHASAVRDIQEGSPPVFGGEKGVPALLCRLARLPDQGAGIWQRDNPALLRVVLFALKRRLPQQTRTFIVNPVCQRMRGKP